MSEHTPGPWNVFTSNEQWSIGAKDDHLSHPEFEILRFGDTASPQDAANARLISAAPDLLAACRAFQNSLEQHKRGGLKPDPTFADWATVAYVINMATAKAIAKAEAVANLSMAGIDADATDALLRRDKQI